MRCVIEDIETVPEGEKLEARAALNSYSWSTPNDDDGNTGETFYIPYTITQIFPASGPASGGTDVIIQGKGFVEGSTDLPRCRFGTPSNYVIVEADVLSYNRMACRTPEGVSGSKYAQWPTDLPFAVALTSDVFEPWTQTSHKFRFYQQPVISRLEPATIAVGDIKEVRAIIDFDPETPENVFFEPMPVRKVNQDDDDEDSEGTYMATMGAFNQLKCNFGRFGDTDAVFVDEQTIKCTTPSIADDPNDIYVEEISFSVSLNGMTFPEEGEDTTLPFTFEGTGEAAGLLPVVLFIVALGLLIAAFIYYCSASISFQSYMGNDDRQ